MPSVLPAADAPAGTPGKPGSGTGTRAAPDRPAGELAGGTVKVAFVPVAVAWPVMSVGCDAADMLRRAQASSRGELIARAYAAGVLAPDIWPPRPAMAP